MAGTAAAAEEEASGNWSHEKADAAVDLLESERAALATTVVMLVFELGFGTAVWATEFAEGVRAARLENNSEAGAVLVP